MNWLIDYYLIYQYFFFILIYFRFLQVLKNVFLRILIVVPFREKVQLLSKIIEEEHRTGRLLLWASWFT
jgi:hypothetical protein